MTVLSQIMELTEVIEVDVHSTYQASLPKRLSRFGIAAAALMTCRQAHVQALQAGGLYISVQEANLETKRNHTIVVLPLASSD